MKAARKAVKAPPLAPPVQLAYCRCMYSGCVSKVPADVARACMSGCNCRPLSSEYWSRTPNAMYRLISLEVSNAH